MTTEQNPKQTNKKKWIIRICPLSTWIEEKTTDDISLSLNCFLMSLLSCQLGQSSLFLLSHNFKNLKTKIGIKLYKNLILYELLNFKETKPLTSVGLLRKQRNINQKKNSNKIELSILVSRNKWLHWAQFRGCFCSPGCPHNNQISMIEWF